MKLLAVDTATDACSVAILAGDEIFERSTLAPREHARLILPMVDELLAVAAVKLHGLDALAFGRGPGAFTGVRMAAGIVQGLALGAGLPVIGISDLAALAQGAMRRRDWPAVLAALDARMGEVYWGAFWRGADGLAYPAGTEMVVAPQDVTAPPGDWRGAGPAWSVYGSALSAAVIPDQQGEIEYEADCLPHAADVARLAAREFERGVRPSAEEALPVYLRDRVASRSPGL
ncbi:MAG: tRNA (adenosine(37)-N6)-threonylcarbamoyltransferase complex dimerization subunit type 1 TsaB [Gammaproteobacteria bacterium]